MRQYFKKTHSFQLKNYRVPTSLAACQSVFTINTIPNNFINQ